MWWNGPVRWIASNLLGINDVCILKSYCPWRNLGSRSSCPKTSVYIRIFIIGAEPKNCCGCQKERRMRKHRRCRNAQIMSKTLSQKSSSSQSALWIRLICNVCLYHSNSGNPPKQRQRKGERRRKVFFFFPTNILFSVIFHFPHLIHN